MVRDSRAASVPTEFTFTERDGGFNRKALTNHTGLGWGEANVFPSGLKAGDDSDPLEEGGAPTSEEAAVAENFCGEAAEGGFKPTQGWGEQGGVGDVVREGVDDMGDAFDHGHQDLGAEFRPEGKLPPHDGTDVIFVKRHNAIRDGRQPRPDLTLLMQNESDFVFGVFEGFQEVPQERMHEAERAELDGGFGS